jgi:Flp pilus assembly protein TadG
MAAILNASAYTMTPYGTSTLSMVVSEITCDNSGAATVTWSVAAYNGTALKAGAAFPLPASMAVANAVYIYGSVTYGYTPMAIGYVLTSPITLSDSAYFSPRVSQSVAYPSPN